MNKEHVAFYLKHLLSGMLGTQGVVFTPMNSSHPFIIERDLLKVSVYSSDREWTPEFQEALAQFNSIKLSPVYNMLQDV